MSRLCIVTALPAESRPFLDALRLRQSRSRHLRLYASSDYMLIETGVGKLNAAAQTAATLQVSQDIGCVINIGIGGGAFEYATTLIAHHIKDRATGAQWYPHVPNHEHVRQFRSTSIITVDTPDTLYKQNTVFDMEASGIYTAASRYLPTSSIHSLKIISDNNTNSIEHINAKQVTRLVENSLTSIISFLDTTLKQTRALCLSEPEAMKALLETTLKQVHHSTNDEQQLRRLIYQHWIICNALPSIDTSKATAKSIRVMLQQSISNLPFNYA